MIDRHKLWDPPSAIPLGSEHARVAYNRGKSLCGRNPFDNKFDTGVNNQGWWSDGLPASNLNPNIYTGSSAGSSLRSFYTFNLASVTDAVVALELQITRGISVGNKESTEEVRFFDVTTSAPVLNKNTGLNSSNFEDLGSGDSYGSFQIPGTGPNFEQFTFTLNEPAVANINAARGGFFSIGGILISDNGDDVVFGGADSSFQEGFPVRLKLTTIPEPRAFAYVCLLLTYLTIRKNHRKATS